MRSAEEIYSICIDTALHCYGATPPNGRYATRVAGLLFGTAAQESSLHWYRQRSVRWDGAVGAFGLWQVELGSVRDSLLWLSQRPEMLRNVTYWLWQDEHATPNWATDERTWLRYALKLPGAERLQCLLARLHYMRFPEPVPESVHDQAAYWKRYYNTIHGAGTVEQYVRNWQNVCQPVLGE